MLCYMGPRHNCITDYGGMHAMGRKLPVDPLPDRMDPDRQLHDVTDADRSSIASIVRWGWYSIAVNVVLVALHGLIAAASGSLAVTAELLHNLVDLASATVVLIGLKLAARKSRAFP